MEAHEETQVVIYKLRGELFEKKFCFQDYFEDDLKNRVTFLNEYSAERLTLNWAHTESIITRPLKDDECI